MANIKNIKFEMEDPDTTSPDFGMCRFCKVQGLHSSMAAAVLGRERGNYCDMLLECFNVFWSTDDTTRSLICGQCATRLRDARDFRQLVLRAQSGLGRATIELEVSAGHIDMDVDIKQEPAESEEPKGPEDLEDPLNVVVKLEPFEPELDIVEHEVTRRQDLSGVSEDNVWADGIDECGMDNVIKVKENEGKTEIDDNRAEESDKNRNAYGQYNVGKFPEEYYIGQDDDEEENSNECDDNPSDELVEVKDFRCDCKFPCRDKFNRDDILKSMLDCREQDYYCQHHCNHQHLLILGALNAMVNTSPQASARGYGTKQRERATIVFTFRGMPVCKKFFLFAHGLGEHKFKNLVKTFKQTGVEGKPHYASTKSVMTAEQKADLVAYIRNFSEQNSIVLPGRSLSNTDLFILPNIMTGTYMYEKYIRTCKTDKKCPVSRPLWKRAWDGFFPDGTFNLPSESCKTCRDLVGDLSKPRTDDTKIKCLTNAVDHLNHVQVQKAYYQIIIAQVIALKITNGKSLGQHDPCSYDGLAHYSFDYLQQVHLPHYPDQESPLNFLDSYKVSLFGVAIEPLQKFVLYIIPEAIPKGINLVVSLLHHFFETYGLGETNAVCHAVANQTKDSTVIQYALWRVMSGLHKTFQLSFLPLGHTKFAPDVHFGFFKSKFRQSVVNCLKDISEIASAYSDITTVIVGNETGPAYVHTCDWKKFFGDISPGPIPKNLTSYVHFKTDATNPGTVMCSKSSPDDFSDRIKVFSKLDTKMPNIIQPQMPFERQQYLYENVRCHVSSEYQDLLCPFPEGRPKRQKEPSDNSGDPKIDKEPSNAPDLLDGNNEQSETVAECLNPSSGKRKIICSYCGIPGHRNLFRHGVYSCKKRKLDMEGSTSQ